MNLVSTATLLRLLTAAGLAAAALVVLPHEQADAAGVPCQRTLSSGLVNRPIGSTARVQGATIDVPEDGLVIADLDVVVNLAHPAPSDLILELRAASDDLKFFPAGSTLARDVSDGTGGFDGTVFDDEARTSISAGVAPFSGRFVPQEPLAEYDGLSNGKLLFQVIDTAGAGDGMLVEWSAILTYRTCDFDSDGVEDHRDQCRDLTGRTVTGCPVATRTVTAKYRSKKFRGALSSPVAACKAGRAVTVFKVRRGADARVGTATTRADGTYKLKRAKKKGRYYATSARVLVPDRAECPAVSSRTFRIR
jgi:hypothetical protein